MEPRPLSRPQLDAGEQVYFEANRKGARFTHPWDPPRWPGVREVIRWRTRLNPYRRAKKAMPALPVVTDAVGHFETMDGPTRVMWIGHASVLIETGGVRVLIDPIFGRAGGLLPRATRSPVTARTVPKPDAVLITHGHHDHLCHQSVRALARRFGHDVVFLVPLGMRKKMPRSCRRIVEVDWWQHVTLGGADLCFVPAQHWHRRSLTDHDRALWGGWVVRGDHTIYHSGDTGHFDGFGTIGRVAGPIDLAVLPLGAYEPRWFMYAQHMAPDDSLRAWQALGAKHFMAMHWGTFDLSAEPLDEGPRELRRLVAEQGLRADRFHVLQHGASLGLSEREVRVTHRFDRA